LVGVGWVIRVRGARGVCGESDDGIEAVRETAGRDVLGLGNVGNPVEGSPDLVHEGDEAALGGESEGELAWAGLVISPEPEVAVRGDVGEGLDPGEGIAGG